MLVPDWIEKWMLQCFLHSDALFVIQAKHSLENIFSYVVIALSIYFKLLTFVGCP